jgi:hypothetical protein
MSARTGLTILVAALAFFASAAASAKTCDCSQNLGSCTAKGSYSAGVIRLSVDTRQCAQVTYDVDGDPRSDTVTDGSMTIDYTPSQPHTPIINVNSCTICKTTE